MKIDHLPSLAQQALRVEAMTTKRRLSRHLDSLGASSAATLLALVAEFAERSMASGAAASMRIMPGPAFMRAMEALCSDVMTPRPEELLLVTDYVTTGENPPHTGAVITMLRAQAMGDAVSLNDGVLIDVPNLEESSNG